MDRIETIFNWVRKTDWNVLRVVTGHWGEIDDNQLLIKELKKTRTQVSVPKHLEKLQSFIYMCQYVKH